MKSKEAAVWSAVRADSVPTMAEYYNEHGSIVCNLQYAGQGQTGADRGGQGPRRILTINLTCQERYRSTWPSRGIRNSVTNSIPPRTG